MASGARITSQSISDTDRIASVTSSRSSLSTNGIPSLIGLTKYGYPFLETTGLFRNASVSLGHSGVIPSP